MVSAEAINEEEKQLQISNNLTAAQKRRNRRKKLQFARLFNYNKNYQTSLDVAVTNEVPSKDIKLNLGNGSDSSLDNTITLEIKDIEQSSVPKTTMSDTKSREDVLAAREAKKLAKQKTKGKGDANKETKEPPPKKESVKADSPTISSKIPQIKESTKSKDEVDRAAAILEKVVAPIDKNRDQVMAERAAKKAAKQIKNKPVEREIPPNPEMTVKDVVETLKEIKIVAKDVHDITAKVSAISFKAKKPEDSGKGKAELKAERRAKQEAQRAAKQALAEQKAPKPKPEAKTKPDASIKEVVKSEGELVKEKSPKPKTDKSKANTVSSNRVNWFEHLYSEYDNDASKKVPLNSTIHPAMVKLGVRFGARTISGSNARCIALVDALQQMIRDYSLPSRADFSRGLEASLTPALAAAWASRRPCAAQTNVVKYLRHHLTMLPNNVDEFDAKKTLIEELDKYVEDQIDKAGEAISIAVRNKISTGDNILTYGWSSLIERILREAWLAGLRFRVVVSSWGRGRATRLPRRLAAVGLPAAYVDITAISFIMKSIDKVILGASALLANGSVLGAVGTAQVALVARAYNVPVLVAAETHKFSERVQTDAFVYNEMGDPDSLIDENDENSPLKDWRSNPNLTPLNLTYDVTPPSLVTAVVTEKAILPCTSAPVVLRTKLSEFGI